MKYTLSEIENFIKNLKFENISYTKHCIEKIRDRFQSKFHLNEELISKCILRNYLVGITYQENEKYLISIIYDESHDLNLTIKIENESLKIITTYIINKERRIRK